MESINILFRISILMLLLISSCSNKSPKKTEEMPNGTTHQKESGIVTVIISPNDPLLPPTHPIPSLSLFNGYYIVKPPDAISKTKETVHTINLYSSIGQICYFHYDGYTYSYTVCPDDTIKINFIDYKPFAESTNKNQKKQDLNWLFYFNNEKLKNTLFQEYLVPVTFNKDKRNSMIEAYREVSLKKSLYVDSLVENNSISVNIYPHIKRDIYLDSIRNEGKKDGYNFQDFDDKNLSYWPYQGCINRYLTKYFKGMYDPRNIFDGLLVDKNVPRKTRLAFLFNKLAEIGAEGTEKDFSPRVAQFLELTDNDSLWAKFVKDVSPLPTIISKEMQLYDIDQKQVDFVSLMNTYKGKVVYIDVWASWCGPCKAAMPAAEELRGKYKDKPVVFLYLAYKDQPNPWKKGVDQYNLNEENAVSFLIASPQAQWVKEMAIRSIPRYMIYDKNGKLVHKNAPDPKNNQLIELINSLL